MWKRIAAALLDVILVFMLAVAVVYILSLAFGYKEKAVELTQIYNEVQDKYGVDLGKSEEEILALSPEIQDEYKKATLEFNTNTRAQYLNAMIISLTMALVTIGTLVSQILLEFVVPLLLKRKPPLWFWFLICADLVRICVQKCAIILLKRPVWITRIFSSPVHIPILVLFW